MVSKPFHSVLGLSWWYLYQVDLRTEEVHRKKTEQKDEEKSESQTNRSRVPTATDIHWNVTHSINVKSRVCVCV